MLKINGSSLVVKHHVKNNSNNLATRLERLSSGTRINSAKDDAAGQAIANRMTSQIRGYHQAQRNTNDGISIAQTTEGSLSQINSSLQRMRELTVQGLNGTQSESDLQSIQNEINQQIAEINRISTDTNFNGIKVLEKEPSSLEIQVGAKDNQRIEISLPEISAAALGLSNFPAKEEDLKNRDKITLENFGEVGVRAAKAGEVGDYFLVFDNPLATGVEALSKVTVGEPGSSNNIMFYDGGGPYDPNNLEVFYVNPLLQNYAAVAGYQPSLLLNYEESDGSSRNLGGAINDGVNNARVYKDPAGDFVFNVGGPADNIGIWFTQEAADEMVTYTYKPTGLSIDVFIESSGRVRDTDGNILYMDSNGLLTTSNDNTKPDTAISKAIAERAASNPDFHITFQDGAVIDTDGDNYFAASNEITDFSMTADKLLNELQKSGWNSFHIATGVTTIEGELISISPTGFVYEASSSVRFSAIGDPVYSIKTNDPEDQGLTLSDITEASIFVDKSTGNLFNSKDQQLYFNKEGGLTTDANFFSVKNEKPLSQLDQAINEIDTARSALGATMNRFANAIENLSDTGTNLTAARSRIEDTNYASETSALIREQIARDAGNNIYSQANRSAELILQLLDS